MPSLRPLIVALYALLLSLSGTSALALPPNADQTVYLRFQSEAAMRFPFTLWSPAAFRRASQHAMLLAGLFYGTLLMMSGALILFFFACVHITGLIFPMRGL